jgi:hypothetical protein
MTRDNWLFAISLAWLIMLWVMIFVVLASCSKAKLICSTGGLANFVSSGRAKNISLSRLVETDLLIPPSRSTEGRIAIVTDAGWDAVDAAASGVKRDAGRV